MASYQEGDEYLGAFLPGLTRMVSQPFKSVAKATTTFFKSPVKGIGQLLMTPVDMAKSFKFAAMGSAPIFKKKATVKKAAVPVKNIISTGSITPQTTGIIPQASYIEPSYQSLSPDSGIPTVSMPQSQSVENVQSAAEEQPPKKSITPIIIGIGVIAAALYFKGKKHGNISRK
jgi:hypothetical protein